MKYTAYQKKVMNYLGLAKVSYDNMWNRNHQIGYVSPDSPFDKIHIAKDFPDKDVKRIALLHECGHVYYSHTSVNTKEELKSIKKLFKDKGKSFELIMHYGGPMSFMNIAMDLVINSKLLTIANVNHMNKYVKICTPDAYGFPVLDDFREYYGYLIDKLDDVERQCGKGDSNLQQSDGDGSGEGGNGKSSVIPQLTKALEDIMNGVSGFDSDLDEDVQKALRKEGYKSGDTKGEDKGNANNLSDGADESTVEDEVDKADLEAEGIRVKEGSKYAGSGHGRGKAFEVVENSSAEIKKFLSQILKPSMVYTPDAFKHYNRGTRHNVDGLLYNSIKRRNRMDKRTLGVLIDCSGSMNSNSIITALSSLKSSMNVVSQDSVVVVWDTECCGEFPITKIPSHVYSGGGTNLATGLEYLVNVKKCTEVVIYSDMYTHMEPMVKLIKDKNIDVYTIEVTDESSSRVKDSTGYGDCWESYYKVNKDYLVVKNI